MTRPPRASHWHYDWQEDMYDSEAIRESGLPLAWVPTRGNHIPPCAVPICEGPNVQLFLARGLVEDETELGTASPLSAGGARLSDNYGRSHLVPEYEVLSGASSLRWHLPTTSQIQQGTVVVSQQTHPITMNTQLSVADLEFPRMPLPRPPPQDRGAVEPGLRPVRRTVVDTRPSDTDFPSVPPWKFGIRGREITKARDRGEVEPGLHPVRPSNTDFPSMAPQKLGTQDRGVPKAGLPSSKPAVAPKSKRGKQNPIATLPSPPSDEVVDWVEVQKHEPPLSLNKRERAQLKHLVQSKCAILIDDTRSMEQRWPQAREALAGMADILSVNDEWAGADVRFLHHAETPRNIKTRHEFEHIFSSVTTCEENKVMAPKVTQMLEDCLPLVKGETSTKPVVLLIFTDGVAADTKELLNAILRFFQKLKEGNVEPNLFRLHILQMGEDRKVVRPLHEFRDQVVKRDGGRYMLNVVSFHPGRGLLNAQNIMRILLAATHIPRDEDPDALPMLPPEVIKAQMLELEGIRHMSDR
ncbi:hypothetical protein HYDPIDRAFT_114614 [Hydnomerulius pinastri MD-312]|uniref:VWFA domain-containing protein n=1 Tax=Hydnomerulius pinastri MD-312 TaxID=994086 RepID=A0A0C9V9W6_9AGAM|nr:hypothetical protein HYDPIDRAFT_114614 [Hydnomerulius pinastri MD-312]